MPNQTEAYQHSEHVFVNDVQILRLDKHPEVSLCGPLSGRAVWSRGMILARNAGDRGSNPRQRIVITK